MSLTRFITDKKGGVLPLFALSIIPLFGFVGTAVDFSRANAVRTSMQAALDSTALMLSKEAPGLDAAQLQTKAQQYFTALFARPEAKNVVVNAPVFTNTGGSKLTISASAQVKADFVGMLGYSALDIGATATVNWGNTKLRVALALDNTGSMSSDGKMAALKTATHNLLNTLQNAALNDGDVYVSIVPFNRDVNIGAEHVNANWLDWTNWDSRNGSNQTVNGQTTWVPNSHTTWNGCVRDRDQNNDVKNLAPTPGVTTTMFQPEQYNSCPASLAKLSYGWTSLHSKVDAMTPAGNTNITIGLSWAWQSLTETAPLNAPPIDPNDTIPTKKIIILLTDGENTQNRWTTSTTSVNARTQKACDNIKAEGITLYTVLVMEGNASLLQGCATDPAKYFFLNNANQIVTTFDQIGTQLSKLRLAQ